jgi:hypothetical protein
MKEFMDALDALDALTLLRDAVILLGSATALLVILYVIAIFQNTKDDE